MQTFFHVAPVGKLGPPVAGDGLDKLGWESGKTETMAFSIVSALRSIVPCLSLCQGGEAGLTFSMTAHNSIRFPVPSFLAAVYQLVSFADGFPFAAFSSCFLRAVDLSLAP